jgi:hypothetical protein
MKTITQAFLSSGLLLAGALQTQAQYPGWQQAVDYTMDITMDADVHQYRGEMTVLYTNNSPDVLTRVPFHLYFNAFQPGSMMDTRSRSIADPDSRVGARIVALTEQEQGWIRVQEASVWGQTADWDQGDDRTIGWVTLPKALKPGKKAKIKLVWDAQVPLQIRRSGWMNAQGVEFSMTQWYPKLCEYDHHGWHTNPYIGREFHGVWGDFDVTIHMDAAYTIGGTGVLQNPGHCGHGYEESGDNISEKAMIDWHFQAQDVHDFAWAADPDFLHARRTMDNGTELHFIYQADTAYGAWEDLPAITDRIFTYYNAHVGRYPYAQYTVIEGGDGGMEYPMCTLVRGNRNLMSLVGVTAHEAAHAWFQGVLATNEALHCWMDEGFTSWIEEEFMNAEYPNPEMPEHGWAYLGYLSVAGSGSEQPLSTHADHYTKNRGYGIAAYSKGQVFLEMLGAVIGDEMRNEAVKTYFSEWSFRHPGPTDFKRVLEKASGLELDWYFEYMVNSTAHIDYAIDAVRVTADSTFITLSRPGSMPMPIDLRLTTSGTTHNYLIPMRLTQGHRTLQAGETLLADWPWTEPTYEVALPGSMVGLTVEIDPEGRLAETDGGNNRVEMPVGTVQSWNKK